MLVCLLVPAHADPLPGAYIGLWCIGGYDDSFSGIKEQKECPDKYIKIDLYGYELNEDDGCKFRSIKYIKRKEAPSTKSRPEDYIPVIRTVALCEGEGLSWTERRELMYQKGQLTSKRPTI
jgi:hypothetical protein